MMHEFSLVDAHAHLSQLDGLPEILERARAAGVTGIIAVGMDLESNAETLKIAAANAGMVYPALGIHPWEIREEEADQSLSFIISHIGECIAIGEIGLDYKVRIKKELQWKVFGSLLDLAFRHDKPAIIHCRFSHRRALEMAVERKIRRAVFHWYSGPLDLLDRILSEGYFISATPALSYSPPHQAAIRRAPLDRILLETDSPVRYQGREARPADVNLTLKEVARLKALELSRVAEQTTKNASVFFRIPFGLTSDSSVEVKKL